MRGGRGAADRPGSVGSHDPAKRSALRERIQGLTLQRDGRSFSDIAGG